MSGGLLPAPEPRRRGRPKGSTNKRPAELKGYVTTRYGSSAAQQAAAICMITPAELKAAGGSMARAQVAKAAELVALVRDRQGDRDGWLRQVVRDELADLAAALPAEGKDLRRVVDGFLARVREASSGFSLKDALAWMASERAQLMPYTDQKQPLALEAKGAGFAPSVVVQVEGLAHASIPTDVEFVEVFEAGPALVAQPKSHGQAQGLDLAEEQPPSDAD